MSTKLLERKQEEASRKQALPVVIEADDVADLPTAVTAAASATKPLITLNIGGSKFQTTRKTLCRAPDSLFEAMLSGRHENAAIVCEDGSYFIDWDSRLFDQILKFLRTGTITIPSDENDRAKLIEDADFYGLESLSRVLQSPPIDVDSFLSEETRRQRSQEEELRKAFQDGSIAGFDAHRGLVPLFSPDSEQNLPLRYQKPVDLEQNGVLLLKKLHETSVDGAPVTVTSLDEFQFNFNPTHTNILHRLENVLMEEPIIIAGGAVLRALTASPTIRTSLSWGDKSDIDIFVHTKDPLEANRIARRIFYALAVDHERWVVVRSRGVVNIHRKSERWNKVEEKCQIVLRLYDSPAEILLGFDCDCCCCAFDGREVWALQRCLSALRTGINILNPLHAWPNKASYELRLVKYARRGFAVFVPGLDSDRIDHDQIRNSKMSNLKGLARFLKAAFEVESAAQHMRWTTPEPRTLPSLRTSWESSLTEDEVLLNAMSGYDDPIDDVIVPSVYVEHFQDDFATGWMWYEYSVVFPPSIDTRDSAWEEIVDVGPESPDEESTNNVPRRLEDSWDRTKRSREYLNSQVDKFDLNNSFYAEAFVKPST